jgi:hypothetical protein
LGLSIATSASVRTDACFWRGVFLFRAIAKP